MVSDRPHLGWIVPPWTHPKTRLTNAPGASYSNQIHRQNEEPNNGLYKGAERSTGKRGVSPERTQKPMSSGSPARCVCTQYQPVLEGGRYILSWVLESLPHAALQLWQQHSHLHQNQWIMAAPSSRYHFNILPSVPQRSICTSSGSIEITVDETVKHFINVLVSWEGQDGSAASVLMKSGVSLLSELLFRSRPLSSQNPLC